MADTLADPSQGLWCPPDTFASRLRHLRYALGNIPVEAIAPQCGVKGTTWSSWENGRQPRGMNDIVSAIVSGIRVHYNLELDRDWLMWGSSFRWRTGIPGQGELFDQFAAA